MYATPAERARRTTAASTSVLHDAHAPMIVVCYHTLEQAAVLRSEVNALNLESERPDPFSTFEFLETFLSCPDRDSSGGKTALWFLAATVDDRLIGYLALSHESKVLLGLQSSTIGFAVTRDADRPHVVARAEDVKAVSAAFLRYLLSRKQEWALLEFRQQDGDSPLFPLPAGVPLDGLATREWPSLENGTIRIRWRSLQQYLAELSKKFRSNVGRQMRHLLACGKVELLSSDDPSVTPALFELYLSIEPRSWKARADACIGRHPSRVAYFRALLDPRQPMRVSIHLLLVDGVPVAGLFCGSFADRLYALQIVYDDRLAALAPGSVMLLIGVRHAIAERCAYFNLLSGFGYFKARWLADIVHTRMGQVYRVDRPPFWKRLAGDSWRRLSRKPAGAEPVMFNPARRAASDPIDASATTREHPVVAVGAGERLHLDALIAAARDGRHEEMDGAALAALWHAEGGGGSGRRPALEVTGLA
jgi:hypothetical protein